MSHHRPKDDAGKPLPCPPPAATVSLNGTKTLKVLNVQHVPDRCWLISVFYALLISHDHHHP